MPYFHNCNYGVVSTNSSFIPKTTYKMTNIGRHGIYSKKSIIDIRPTDDSGNSIGGLLNINNADIAIEALNSDVNIKSASIVDVRVGVAAKNNTNCIIQSSSISAKPNLINNVNSLPPYGVFGNNSSSISVFASTVTGFTGGTGATGGASGPGGIYRAIDNAIIILDTSTEYNKINTVNYQGLNNGKSTYYATFGDVPPPQGDGGGGDIPPV